MVSMMTYHHYDHYDYLRDRIMGDDNVINIKDRILKRILKDKRNHFLASKYAVIDNNKDASKKHNKKLITLQIRYLHVMGFKAGETNSLKRKVIAEESKLYSKKQKEKLLQWTGLGILFFLSLYGFYKLMDYVLGV